MKRYRPVLFCIIVLLCIMYVLSMYYVISSESERERERERGSRVEGRWDRDYYSCS